MPISALSIANTALAKLGSERISSLTQETKSAQLINAIYDLTRDQVLRDHPWNFALKRATLAPTADTPPFEWDYEYDLPNDCLRPWKIYPDNVKWIVEGRKILTNEADGLNVVYIYRHEDESSWSTDFCKALAYRLAADVAYGLTSSQAKEDACMKDYEKMLREARSIDGAEGIIQGLIADDWTNARL